MRKVVFAIAAHPDDIEFLMAGTLFLLKDQGYEMHYMNLADGYCGSTEYRAKEIIKIRMNEAHEACKVLGATFHKPLVKDIEILYEIKLLKRLCSLIRMIRPQILLVHSPDDYMEDHMQACRLAVSAAFCRNIPNFMVVPKHDAVFDSLTVYHAQPHGNRGYLGELISPDIFVDITSVIEKKIEMLSKHKSQKDWLDKSQGLDSYIEAVKVFSSEIGRMSQTFQFAEGWRRHSHLGFCKKDRDPLSEELKKSVLQAETAIA